MPLAIFDLDNTLIAGDSDHLWGEFLCSEGLVDAQEFKAQNDQFYADYQRGELDIRAYLEFALSPLVGRSLSTVAVLQERFMDRCIEPILLDAANALIAEHRAKGDTLLIITATNELVTRPIADRLGIADLLGCEVATRDGKITGKATGVLTYKEGKVTRLQQWVEARGMAFEAALADASFYSDSHNDLPLLERVGRPVAVDPDRTLHQHALSRSWEVLSLRA
ncbi:MAG: HAD family hydrolase [Congregibacter sp.]